MVLQMAQQIDRVSRSVKELDGTPQRLVITQGNATVKEQQQAAQQSPRETQGEDREAAAARLDDINAAADSANARSNWVKAAAMATGRFVPQKSDNQQKSEKRGGYFAAPAK